MVLMGTNDRRALSSAQGHSHSDTEISTLSNVDASIIAWQHLTIKLHFVNSIIAFFIFYNEIDKHGDVSVIFSNTFQ
jgi:hypothetical protein